MFTLCDIHSWTLKIHQIYFIYNNFKTFLGYVLLTINIIEYCPSITKLTTTWLLRCAFQNVDRKDILSLDCNGNVNVIVVTNQRKGSSGAGLISATIDALVIAIKFVEVRMQWASGKHLPKSFMVSVLTIILKIDEF